MAEKPLKVMVTGATGLTGSHTVRALLARGHRVNALVRTPSKAHRSFTEQASGLEIVKGDIEARASVERALEGCDGVIHCAAVVAVGQAESPRALLDANVAGVRNVIDSALERGIDRVVHVSSLATLFRGDGTPLTEQSEPQESDHPYGQSKTLADRYVRQLQAARKPVKIVYPGAIIGPDDPGLSESMMALRTFIRDFVPLTSAGMQLVDARDLAVAHARILESEPGARRYLVPGTFLRWAELRSELEAATGTRVRAIRFPAPILRVTGRLLDLLRRVAPVRLPLTAEAAAYVTRWDPVSASPSLREMGVRFRDVSESIADAVRWMRQAGHL